ncbi:hypothetical protein [Nonomuraea sp. NPDC005692]|uniref:Ig-like domain-containing protein n=1 Tax=Nonomuraea sp. NPDC005692 TaxID=3157168 RepID=UPI0033E8EB3E
MAHGNAGGGFAGIAVDPPRADVEVGKPVYFKVTFFGLPTAPVTWKVTAGPGTIDAAGKYVADRPGVAEITATTSGRTVSALVFAQCRLEASPPALGMLGPPPNAAATAGTASARGHPGTGRAPPGARQRRSKARTVVCLTELPASALRVTAPVVAPGSGWRDREGVRTPGAHAIGGVQRVAQVVADEYDRSRAAGPSRPVQRFRRAERAGQALGPDRDGPSTVSPLAIIDSAHLPLAATATSPTSWRPGHRGRRAPPPSPCQPHA